MTRKRRISEAVATCNVRDPLNLKDVTTEAEPCVADESAAKVPNVQACVQFVGGESSQNSSIPLSRKADDFRTRHESLSQHKSLPPFTTPPRLIRPLLARNPKDPLDLLGSGRPEEAGLPVSRTNKVTSPIVPTAANNNLCHVANEAVPKPANNRKRRRNRSMALSEADHQLPRPSRGGDDISPTTNAGKPNVGTVPTSREAIVTKSAKKSRRGNRRKRKRRHGGKKKTESSDASAIEKPEEQGKNKESVAAKPPVPKKRPPYFTLSTPVLSPLSLLCSSVRSLFSKSQVLHIGACGDNGYFSVQLATQYGAERVVGVDRCMKRIRIARRLLGSLSGQISLQTNPSVTSSAGDQRKSPKIFPRCFPVCFGPIGPDANNPLANTLLRTVEFSYVTDYTNILPAILAGDESPPSMLWDTVILQESVVASILCNPLNGPVAIHRLLTRISNSLRTGGHLVLVLGRLRWQKQLKTFRSLSASQPSTESVVIQDENGKRDVTAESSSNTGIPAAAQLHPLTQLRKFFRFRLVRRLASPLSSSRLRRPSSVSWRGISPFQARHGHRHHLQSHVARPQSLLSTISSLHGPIINSSGENGKNTRRYGGSHRIVFVLQKKLNEPAAKIEKSQQQEKTLAPSEQQTESTTVVTSSS